MLCHNNYCHGGRQPPRLKFFSLLPKLNGYSRYSKPEISPGLTWANFI